MKYKKQIEEICKMAVLVCRRNPQAHEVEDCIKCEFKNGMCDVYRVAEKIYEQNYRKLQEDSVVLTREEQERILTATEKRIEQLKEENGQLRLENNDLEAQINQARKETAREILKELYGFFPKDKQFTMISRATILAIAKQFGVEVE
jgi:hypothetical protein